MENVCKEMISYLNNHKFSIRADELALKFTGSNVMTCAYGMVGESFSSGTCVMNEIRESMSMSTKIGVVTHTLGLFCPNLCKLLNISYLGKQVPVSFGNLIRSAVKSRERTKNVSNDFVDFLIECKRKGDLSFLGHAMTFFLDGYETSAYLLTYTLLELARNPSVQVEAQSEIDVVCKAHNTIYSYGALKELSYLEDIIYETLRIHPVIKFLNRSCTKECLLPSPYQDSDGMFVQIKKGTQIFIPVEAIHRDTKYYHDPKKFDPHRFKQENRSRRPKQSFLGFGDGPRICPGQQFAVTQIKIALAAILLHFNISINAKTIFPLRKKFYHLSKFPKNEIWLDFSVRTTQTKQ
ncbi:hypothetical protein RI129_001926 [Pyrocoelia pectoralis]|uniref:Cytochrome P450 n=1 Tax=Pyrocoelia pectoralis TaxID=417401 RepID=A0AAN7ZUF4_9COLE